MTHPFSVLVTFLYSLNVGSLGISYVFEGALKGLSFPSRVLKLASMIEAHPFKSTQRPTEIKAILMEFFFMTSNS